MLYEDNVDAKISNISYGLVGFIPLDELMEQETA